MRENGCCLLRIDDDDDDEMNNNPVTKRLKYAKGRSHDQNLVTVDNLNVDVVNSLSQEAGAAVFSIS